MPSSTYIVREKYKGIVATGEISAYCRAAWISGLDNIIFSSIH